MAGAPPPITQGQAKPGVFPQWGIGKIGGTWKVIKASNEAEKLADAGLGYLYWLDSQAAAENQISSQTSALNGNLPNPFSGWHLSASGLTGWFMRGLKVTFGGILLILAVSHLTGLSNTVTQTAGKLAPIAAVAA